MHLHSGKSVILEITGAAAADMAAFSLKKSVVVDYSPIAELYHE